MVKSLVASIFVLGVLSISTLAFAQAHKDIPAKDRRFDHKAHDEFLKAKGKPSDCTTCHKVNADTGAVTGRNHDRCDNSGCHNIDHDKQSGSFITDKVAQQCAVCHIPTKPRPGLPPQPKDKSWVSRFTHNFHLQLGSSITDNCASCHEQESAGTYTAPKDAHSGCAGCHGSKNKKVTMAQCSGCHVDPSKAMNAKGDEYSLLPFDHSKHKDKSKLANDCTNCHKSTGQAVSNDESMVHPSMKSCLDGCHNGTKAFSAVGTTCTQCHHGNTAPPAAKRDVMFSHGSHRNRNVNIDNCADCHTVQKDGKVEAPNLGKDHMPCAKSGCHEPEFLNRPDKQKVCGTCHDNAAPWAKPTARLMQPAKSEFFGTINHQTHLKLDANCQGCHGNKLKDEKGPKEHEGCATGGKCHGGTTAPQMNDCKLCHKKDAVDKAPVSAWSVAANFKHSTHANDPRSHQQTECKSCHANVATAVDLKTVTLPVMKSCDSCHDGKSAFKTTGFDCAKCHAKTMSAPPLAPASAPAPTSSMMVIPIQVAER